jgi:hypothetical protein
VGELGVGHEIEGVAALEHPAGRLAAGGSVDPLRVVDGEAEFVFSAAHPQVVDRPVEQDVVVGAALLEDALAAGEVGIERGMSRKIELRALTWVEA